MKYGMICFVGLLGLLSVAPLLAEEGGGVIENRFDTRGDHIKSHLDRKGDILIDTWTAKASACDATWITGE